MDEMNNLSKTVLGLGSVSLIETIPVITPAVGMDLPAVVQTIIQLIVGIGTLISLFKRKKSVIN